MIVVSQVQRLRFCVRPDRIGKVVLDDGLRGTGSDPENL